MNSITETAKTYSLGGDTWLPIIDHVTPNITAYNYVFQSAAYQATVESSPPLPYAQSQYSPAVDRNDAALAWIGANWQALTEQYPNCWVVISDGRVVAHSETPDELREEIVRLGIECPFITKVGEGPIVWNTAYAR